MLSGGGWAGAPGGRGNPRRGESEGHAAEGGRRGEGTTGRSRNPVAETGIHRDPTVDVGWGPDQGLASGPRRDLGPTCQRPGRLPPVAWKAGSRLSSLPCVAAPRIRKPGEAIGRGSRNRGKVRPVPGGTGTARYMNRSGFHPKTVPVI